MRLVIFKVKAEFTIEDDVDVHMLNFIDASKDAIEEQFREQVSEEQTIEIKWSVEEL